MEGNKTVVPSSDQSARHAIDGAIEYGRQGINKPHAADHWLMPYWQMGRAANAYGDLAASLKDALRMLEAVRYTTGFGKSQLERIEKARAALAAAEQS